MERHAYVVEGPIHGGVARVYVDSEERAKQIVEDGRKAGAERTYRQVELVEMPEKARANLLRARAERA